MAGNTTISKNTDLAQTTEQISRMQKAMEGLITTVQALGGITNTVFQNMGGQMGQAANRAQNYTQVQQASFTPEEAATAQKVAFRNLKKAQSAGLMLLADETGNLNVPPRLQASIGGLGTIHASNLNNFSDFQKNVGQAVNYAASTNRPPPFSTGPISQTSIPELGRVSSQGANYQAGNIGDILKRLQQSNDVTAQATAKAFSLLSNEIAKNTEAVKEASRDFVDAGDNAEKLAKAQEKLDRSTESLGVSLKARERIEASARGMDVQYGPPRPPGSGGGGGGGFGGFLSANQEKIKVGLGYAAGVVGLGVGAGLAYGKYELSTLGAVAGKGIEADKNMGSIAQLRYQRQMEAIDPSSIESFYKTSGDLFVPGAFKYQGKTGLGRASEEADRQLHYNVETDERQRSMNKWSSAGQMIGGAIGMAAGLTTITTAALAEGTLGVLASPVAIPALIAGTGLLMSGYSAFTDADIQGRANALENVSTGGVNNTIKSSRGDQAARDARAAAVTSHMLEREQNINALRGAELQNLSPMMRIGGQSVLDLRFAQSQSAKLIGSYAGGWQASVTNRLGSAFKQQSDAESSINKAQGDALAASWSGGDPSSGPLSLNYTNAPQYLSDSASRLGMSQPEFMLNRAALSNSLAGRSASVAETSRVAGLSMGLGSMEQITSGVASLNRLSGGQNNIGLMEKVLANAVSQGFDKSRSAQAFVQTTTQIMASLGTTGTTSADMLSLSTRLMGGVKGDERDLARAAKGAMDYGSFTGQASGFSGIVKSLAFRGQNIAPGALSTLTSMNQDQLQSLADNWNDPNNKTVRGLKSEGVDIKQIQGALGSTARTYLDTAMVGATTEQRARVNKATDWARTHTGKLTKTEQAQWSRLSSDAMDAAAFAGASSTLGPEGAMQALTANLRNINPGMYSEQDRMAALNAKRASDVRAAVDPAIEKRQAFINAMIGGFAQKTGAGQAATAKDYKEMLRAGAEPLTIGGKTLTKDMPDTEVDKALKDQNMTKLDLVRSAKTEMDTLSGSTQSVTIANLTDLQKAFLSALTASKTSGNTVTPDSLKNAEAVSNLSTGKPGQ